MVGLILSNGSSKEIQILNVVFTNLFQSQHKDCVHHNALVYIACCGTNKDSEHNGILTT